MKTCTGLMMLAVGVCVVGCVGEGGDVAAGEGGRVGESLVVVEVVEYSSDAMHDSTLVDGMIIHEDWYDTAICEIVSPAELAGQRLQVWGWNRQGGPLAEAFTQPGNTVRLRCDLSSRRSPPWGGEPTGFGQWEITIEPAE